jgi:hypothetical protein
MNYEYCEQRTVKLYLKKPELLSGLQKVKREAKIC